MSFYEVFHHLCQKKGVTPTQFARENQISQPVVSMWKIRGSVPKPETLKKIADYFGVSMEYLAAGKLDEDVYPSEETYKEPDEKGKVIIPSVLSGVDGFEGLDDAGRPILKKGSPAESMYIDEQRGMMSVKYAKKRIEYAFSVLKEEGRIEAANRVEELTFIPKYRKKDT